MDLLALQRKDVEEELRRMVQDEERITRELDEQLEALQKPFLHGSSSLSHGVSVQSSSSMTQGSNSGFIFEMSSIGSELKKVENVAPMLESLSQNAKKLAGQVEDCRSLSDRISSIVRQLDVKQMRAQKALACTQDILSLKDCRHKIIAALEQDNDLPTAVKHLKHVHSIDPRILDTSEDYHVILTKEVEIKSRVQSAFQAAIAASDIEQVMLYCPLLQFLNLQDEARDNLLLFFNEKIFVSLDCEHALATTNATDATTAYIQALLHIFNTSYIIIQTYLPIVLQGLEECHGDVYFLRNLHAKVESQVSTILKKYIKYRTLNEFVASIQKASQTHASAGTSTLAINTADVHATMDEVALIVQYCSKYSKYLKHICHGAESRVRGVTPVAPASAAVASMTVFLFPLEFDKMVEEVVNKYYIPGETYLMKSTIAAQQSVPDLDVVFFVLRKCGLRAMATNSIHAALALSSLIAGMVSGEVLATINTGTAQSLTKVTSTLADYFHKYKKSLVEANNSSSNHSSSTASKHNLLSRGLFSLMTTGSGDGSQPGQGNQTQNPGQSQSDLDQVTEAMEAFNRLEVCISYTDRLAKDIFAAADNVFTTPAPNGSQSHISDPVLTKTGSTTHSKYGKSRSTDKDSGSLLFHNGPSESDKLRACRDLFDHARQTFHQLMRHAGEQIATHLAPTFKELFQLTTDPNHHTLYIQYGLAEMRFEGQANLVILPKVFMVPVENILYILTSNLSEKSTDVLVSMVAEICCDKLEAFIKQNSFSYSGAMKMEEVVRSLNGLFTRYSSTSVRVKFTRLREVMQVLTSASLGDSLNENYTLLTATEIEALFSLRVEL